MSDRLERVRLALADGAELQIIGAGLEASLELVGELDEQYRQILATCDLDLLSKGDREQGELLIERLREEGFFSEHTKGRANNERADQTDSDDAGGGSQRKRAEGGDAGVSPTAGVAESNGDEQRVLSVKELADRWNLDQKTVREGIALGQIPAFRVGRRRLLIPLSASKFSEKMAPSDRVLDQLSDCGDRLGVRCVEANGATSQPTEFVGLGRSHPIATTRRDVVSFGC